MPSYAYRVAILSTLPLVGTACSSGSSSDSSTTTDSGSSREAGRDWTGIAPSFRDPLGSTRRVHELPPTQSTAMSQVRPWLLAHPKS